MELTKNNFRVYAIKAYDNPYCISEQEFDEDLYRTTMIKRMLTNYLEKKQVNIKLLLNTIRCFYNVFKHKEATHILDFKLSEQTKPFLNSALLYLNLPIIEKEEVSSILLFEIKMEMEQ